MLKILTWITTVGWSPYAVINPIWAYCKDKKEVPDKVIMLHTDSDRIKKNSKLCEKVINKILKEYSGADNFKPEIETHTLKSEDIELYTEKLKHVIEKTIDEQNSKGTEESNLIILDMTPGRKYMSAKVMNFGELLNTKENPIQVFYLSLAEMKYSNNSYPTIPIIKHGLYNILEDNFRVTSEALHENAQTLEPPQERVQIENKINKIFEKNLIEKIKDEELKLEFIVLSAIYLTSNTTVTAINQFARRNGFTTNKYNINNTIRRLGLFKGYLYNDRVFGPPMIDVIILTEDGEDYLTETIDYILNGMNIDAAQVNALTLVDDAGQIKNIKEIDEMKFNMNEKFKFKSYIDLSVDELIILLNELYSNNLRTFNLVDCIYGFNLCKINIEMGKNSVIINFGNILKKIPRMGRQKEFFENHCAIDPTIPDNFFLFAIPHKTKFLDAFRKAGVFFSETNEKEFDRLLNEIVDTNPINGDLYKIISFDTCTYSNQTFSHLYKYYKNNNKFTKKINKLDFLVSRGVVNEMSEYENKYSNNVIEYLKKTALYPNIVDKFRFQSTLQARLTKLAHCDYLKCKALANVKTVDLDDNAALHNDTRIISGLASEIARFGNLHLSLYSHDENFYGRASGLTSVKCMKLNYKQISHNDESNYEISCDWDEFERILYYLSVTFGAIILNINDKEKFVLFGIWPRQKTEDWQNEKLRIYSHNPILQRMSSDFRIISEDDKDNA